MDTPDLERALTQLGELLQYRALAFDVAVIGGGAMLLQALIARPTKDLDVVARIEGATWSRGAPLDPALQKAVVDVAHGLKLPEDWLNAAPASVFDSGDLPPGFAERATIRVYGGLTLRLTRSGHG
jgi:hypothetical protein